MQAQKPFGDIYIMKSKKTAYDDYTMGLAIFDLLPVMLFLLSGLIIWSISGSTLFLAGMVCSFLAGMLKVIWKMIIVEGGEDRSLLTKLFRLLMPAGFILMILSAILAVSAEKRDGIPEGCVGISEGFRTAMTMPAVLFFLSGIAGMCLMGSLASRLDKSAKSAWIEESVNAAAQLLILAGTISLYFGIFYHADAVAKAALISTDTVRVTRSEDEIFFNGPGEDKALIFYPGAKVEAEAYAPLMMKIADEGFDCFLCDVPLNFALFDIDAAGDVMEEYGNSYSRWYIGGHSLGGVAASEYTLRSDAFDGLVLLASYPSKTIKTPVLLIYGTNDRVLKRRKAAKAFEKGLFPHDTAEFIIRGGNHAGFGNYGFQKGDDEAEVSSEEQQQQTADLIRRFGS